MKSNELKSFIQDQTIQAPKRLEGYTKNANSDDLPKRAVFSELKELTDNFLDKKAAEPRIVILPGLRGVGKTTLLSQLFLSISQNDVYKLYLSVDELVKRFDASLWEIMDLYEEIIDEHIERLDNPIILFLDEIHYDKKWASFLKSMYDRSKKMFIVCTGSAALLLREEMNTDLARRVFFLDIYPVGFVEYLKLKDGKPFLSGVGKKIKESLLYAEKSNDLFEMLKKEEKEVKRYWLDIDRLEVGRYLRLGTFPFTLASQNESLSLGYIGQVVSKIVYADLPQFAGFDIETLNKIEKVLYLLADSSTISLTRLSSFMEVKKDTLSLILRALEKSSLLLRVLPYGAHYKQVRKPSKYLFASPSLRFFFLSSRESVKSFEKYKGNLLEDTIGMYLQRIIPKYGAFSVTYDVSEGGADFIIGSALKKWALEVGFGAKGEEQARESLARVKGNYGVVISESELSVRQNIVKMPLKYFLMIN